MRKLPFGYRLKGDRVVRDEAEQSALTIIRRLRSKGHSLEDIAQVLSEKGFKPRVADRWRPESLRQILGGARQHR